MIRTCLFLFLLVVTSLPVFAAEPTYKNLVFAKTETGDLKLDIYMPKEAEKPQLIVFIHGGGWRNNSYKKCHTPWLTDYGFAVASISYRLTDKATFPAQIHDCKSAVRWLRANSDKYGYNAEKIGVTGTSAGGHLSLLMGVTNSSKIHEGTVGGNLDQSSAVHAIVDFYGPSDFLLRSKNQPVKTEIPDSPVWLLLGGPVSKKQEIAKVASPAFHVSKDDPPLLIYHGDKDGKVKMDQSQRMVDEYKKLNLDVKLFVIEGAGHGGKQFFEKDQRKLIADFFKSKLK